MAETVRHTPTRRRVAATTALLVLASACAGAGGAGRAVGPRTPGAIANGELVPGRPPAEAYGGPAGGGCQSSPIITMVMDELTGAAERAGRTPPALDPAVCAVAEAFLGWDPATTPRPQVLSFVSHYFGLPGTVLPPTVATLATDKEKDIAERIVQSVGNSVVNAVYPRLGIAVQRMRRGKEVSYRVSYTLLDAAVELAPPLPRKLAAGEEAKLSGRLLAGVTGPRVLVSDAQGQLSTPEQPPGEAFEAPIRCGERPGRIQVELRGTYEGSEGLVASFPVACGQEPPARVALAGEPWPTDPAAAERRILELVNEERTAAGLEPLAWDPAVAEVARGISRDLAERGSAGGQNLTDRLKAEGIASPLVLQSAASERSFERAHERLLASPTNRANLMNPEVTNAGVGAASRAEPQGRPIVYVTEVFIRELPPVDVAKTRQALRDAVAQKRRDARANPLRDDPKLDEVAQGYAEALAAAGGSLPKEKASELTAPLNKGFTRVTMVSGAKQEPLDLAEEPQTTAPGRSLGVGVAQGRHPVLGRNATYVVLMVGTPRR